MLRIGVDIGGTKIEAAVLGAGGQVVARQRAPNPGAYDAMIETVRDLVAAIEGEVAGVCTLGVGVPGSIGPRDGLMRNANAVFLNGKPLREDLSAALGRPVRIANDANCMALSEAVDGAAADARVAFGVILGTGVGGGLVIDGRLVEGATGIGGEWGHTPLPWMTAAEFPGPACWCGQRGCLDLLISGTGLRLDHERRSGERLDGEAIVAAARHGDQAAAASVAACADRLGRALAMVVNLVDPDVIVLGGGLSNVPELYPALPRVIAKYAFGGGWDGRVLPARWGDASGVRGAAWLWPIEGGETVAWKGSGR